MPCLIEQIGRRSDGHVLQHVVAIGPRVTAGAVAADRQIGDETDRHARVACRAVCARKALGCKPLQEQMKLDLVAVLAGERFDLAAARMRILWRPVAPMSHTGAGTLERIERFEARVVFERLAAAREEALEVARECAVRVSLASAKTFEKRTQHLQTPCESAGPIDQREPFHRGPCIACVGGIECRLRGVKPEDGGRIDVRDIDEEPRRRRIGAEFARLGAEHRMRRTHCQRMRAATRGAFGELRQRGKIADAAVAGATQPVDLCSDAPDRRLHRASCAWATRR